MGDSLRSILIGVDKLVWDHAAEYFGYTWNRCPRANYARLPWANDLSPVDIRLKERENRKKRTLVRGPVGAKLIDGKPIEEVIDFEDEYSPPKGGEDIEVSHFASGVNKSSFMSRIHRFKRFGVLCFALRQPKDARPKLAPARHRGIFLGYAPESNSFKIGIWKQQAKTLKWDILESESVRFTQYLVRDIEHLKPDCGSVAVTVDDLTRLDQSSSASDYWQPSGEASFGADREDNGMRTVYLNDRH